VDAQRTSNSPPGEILRVEKRGGVPAVAPAPTALDANAIRFRVSNEDEDAYAGPSGGAVGGTPANKRASGGRTERGIAPHSDVT